MIESIRSLLISFAKELFLVNIDAFNPKTNINFITLSHLKFIHRFEFTSLLLKFIHHLSFF